MENIHVIPSVSVNNNVNIFTTVFTIQHCNSDDINCINIDKFDVFAAYRDLMVEALEARMRACMDMLFRNRNRVLFANENQVTFKKANGVIHSFNIPSFKAMEEMLILLTNREYLSASQHIVGLQQTLKALYWVEKPNADINNISFGDLISCLEACLLKELSVRETV